MGRTRKAATLAISFGLIATAAGASSTTGCTTAVLKDAPDAALPECKRGPFLFSCTAAAGQPSCNTANGPPGLLKELPANTDYPVGCVINWVGARDAQGDCRLERVCKCRLGELPPTVVDAGDPEAGPKVVPSTTGPVWICG